MNLPRLLPLTAAFAALLPASASAIPVTFTQSAIDTPVDRAQLATPQPVHVSGTAASGGLVATGQLICTYRTAGGTTAWSTLDPTVAVENGGFSSTIDSAALPPRLPCRLRLIPWGTPPPDLSPFTGPRVIGLEASRDYAAWDLTSHFSLDDAARCGVESVGLSDVDGDDPLSGPDTIGCAAHLRSWADDPSLVPAGRSEVRIDGADAFLQNAAPIARERDAFSGDVRWSETHDVVRCTHPVFPADDEHAGECGSLVPTGVRFERSGVAERDGTVIVLRDRWSSTDGAAHDLDLLPEFDLVTGPDSGVWFPWVGDFFEQYAVDTSVPRPSLAGPGSFFTRPDRSRLGVLDPTTAISYSDAPDLIRWGRFETVTAAAELAYDRHVAADEPYRQAFVLSTSPSPEVAQVMAVDGEERLSPPQVSIVTPADGAGVPAGSVTVTGAAHDNHGIASLTLNGEPVAREGDLWRATLTLPIGSATVVVRAVDNDGNVAVARRSVTVVPTIPAPATDDPVSTPAPAPAPAPPGWTPAPPAPRCVVPSVRGLTLAKARAGLRAAHCIVGRVQGKAKRRPRIAVVVRQSPKAGTSAPAGSYIALDVRRPRGR